MTNNPKKEIRVSCDFENDTALVRIFKYRNYSWSGGRVYELKRESPRLKKLGEIISTCRDVKVENKMLSNFSEIFWQEKTEKAVSYNVDMSLLKKKEEKDG